MDKVCSLLGPSVFCTMRTSAESTIRSEHRNTVQQAQALPGDQLHCVASVARWCLVAAYRQHALTYGAGFIRKSTPTTQAACLV